MKVTIYSTRSCGFCKMLKKYLDDKDVKYIEKWADDDESVAKELFEKSHQFAVPWTLVEKDDGTEIPVLGFSVPEINKALSIS